MTDKSNIPAFPITSFNSEGNITTDDEFRGMSLRDYFAAKAMQSLLLKPNENSGVTGVNRFQHRISEDAYKYADAMLEARK